MTADGQKLTPMVIFKRKTIPKEKFPPNIFVRANPKGWINGALIEDWMENVWLKRSSAFFAKSTKEDCLLIYDACTAHLTDEVKAAVQKHTKLAVIPGGLTKFLQSLDISVNKSFKSHLRKSWENWMENEEMISLTKGGNRRKATFSTVTEWIVSAWRDVTPETIKNGFKKAGIHSYGEDQSTASNYSDTENNPHVIGISEFCDEMELDSLDKAPPPSASLENNFELLQIDDDSEDFLVGDEFDG